MNTSMETRAELLKLARVLGIDSGSDELGFLEGADPGELRELRLPSPTDCLLWIASISSGLSPSVATCPAAWPPDLLSMPSGVDSADAQPAC